MPFTRDQNGSGGDGDNTPIIVFDGSKDELKSLQQDLKILNRKFKSQYKMVLNKDDVSREYLAGVKAVVFAAPRKRLEMDEIKALKDFMADGGNVLIMASEGKESDSFVHLNKLTEEFGIRVNDDAVVRTVYYKEYFHPKEAFLKNVTLLDEIEEYAGKGDNKDDFGFETSSNSDKLSIAYPYGCTLQISSPATPLLTTGQLAFPANRCIMACSQVKKGKLFVLGSCQVFDDNYLTKADNVNLATAVLKMITEPVKLGNIDPDRPEFGDRIEIPDTEALAEQVRACLQEGEELPMDFTELFDHALFKYDVSMIPEAVRLYDKLHVKHEPLSLIPPQFEVPLPPLQPAVFMPRMRELPPPGLDLFDLDEEFSDDKLRLAQLTNKCSDADLEYYVREAGEVLGVVDQVREETGEDDLDNSITGHQVLYYIFQKLVNYKKINTGGSTFVPPNMNNDVDTEVTTTAQDEDRGGADVMTFD